MTDKEDKNSRVNSIDISGTITDSTISVNQNQDGNQSINQTKIEYVIDKNSYSEKDGESYKKPTKIFYVSLGVSALGVLADMTGLLAYLGFYQGIAILILVPICWLIAVVTKNDRWVSSLPNDQRSYYRNGQWYEKLPNNNVARYSKSAKCIYPKCEGVVNIVPAPPREKSNHNLVGVCNLDDIQHTYSIDFNAIGYPQKFDWRPMPKDV